MASDIIHALHASYAFRIQETETTIVYSLSPEMQSSEETVLYPQWNGFILVFCFVAS